MDPIDFFPAETFSQQASFQFIRPDEFKTLGIDPKDIPLGTIAAQKHPCQLQSRFGGNAYGFGFFEVYDKLKPKDIRLVQTITFEDPEVIREHYKDLNEIYKKIGLLIRFSSLGRPYYLIPVHFISNNLSHVRAKVDEISKIVGFHLKKYLKKRHEIGILSHQDDLIPHELSFRFKEHRFVVLDSLDKIQSLNQELDLIILTRDVYETILIESFSPLSKEKLSKKRLDQYATYILWKLYNLLKPDGEIFIITRRYTPKTNRTAKIVFKTDRELKNFVLFTHIFKTRKKYSTKDRSLQVNILDFQNYLGDPYVEQELEDKLLNGKSLDDMTVEQADSLPYMDFHISNWPFLSNQEKIWDRLLSVFFTRTFLKPVIPQSIKEDWGKRFFCTDYVPDFMMTYLGRKRPLKTTTPDLRRDVTESGLSSFSTDLLADYRDSFEYVIRTLRVLDKLKRGNYKGLPHNFIDRLKQPLENKNRRFSALDDVITLITKIRRLEKTRDYLNPDGIEGSRTKVLKNLEALDLFGFSHNELKEIFYIILGHTSLGRIISGKMNEKALKPLSDLARTYDLQQALNLLRYCRLMTMAEIESARRSELTQEELALLFDVYESIVRIVTDENLDWDTLLDEKITSMGGVHYKIVQKLLMMMSHFEFLDNWSKLNEKGQMEKESLADYDDRKLSRIEDVINLVSAIEQFEEMYLKFDPLQLPVFYRKFLDIEFHGTGHIFERMEGRNVFVLLWIAVNVVRGEVINFNPVLADVETSEIDEWVKKVEQEARLINIHHLDLAILAMFSEQLYQNGFSFVVGTGFLLKTDPETQALEVAYMDMDKDIEQLESLSTKLAGLLITEIPVQDLKKIETLFSNLDKFYQSHIRLLGDKRYTLKLPARQIRWFEKVQSLREYLRSDLLNVTFPPECIYTDLDLLYNHAPSILNFILPEFMALQDLDISSHLYLKSPVIHYIISVTKKLQALIRHDSESFQDTHFLHTLAQREFGPMATGIVGASQSQIEDLEEIIEHLSHDQPFFDALIKSFMFQDIGRIPALREKYEGAINPADLSQAGAFFVEKEKIAERYNFDEKANACLTFLVRHHGLLHHIFRGELSFYAIEDVVDPRDKDLFDAFFVFSFIMLSSIREDLVLEDLAGRLFQIRTLCHRIIDGTTTPEAYLDEIFAQKGKLFNALETFQIKGLPEGLSPSDYLESEQWEKLDQTECLRAGKMIFALERIFRLRGIRYVEFPDLVNLMLKVPLKYIYRKRRFSSIGYDTFEKEVLEAFRIYNTLQDIAEPMRHFILNQLIGDKVRIFGYEKVSGYLSHENQVKLLLVGLLGTTRFKPDAAPICLSFLGMSEKIAKRYEAVNEHLNTIPIDELWENRYLLSHLFKAKTALLLTKEDFPNVLSVDFKDPVNISQKISHMHTIDNPDQLKNYFRHTLRSLKKYSFYTDDYEVQLEEAFKMRLTEIADRILNQTKAQMDLINDFKELHELVSELLDQSRDIEFSYDQKHRLNDLYEFRKDNLKRNKLSEIDAILETFHDIREFKDYWDTIKWYLQENRRFFGKEFEVLVANKFDAMSKGLTPAP